MWRRPDGKQKYGTDESTSIRNSGDAYCQCHAGVVRYETDYGILLMSVCQNPPQGGGCPKSQTFLSENQKSASGLV